MALKTLAASNILKRFKYALFPSVLRENVPWENEISVSCKQIDIDNFCAINILYINVLMWIIFALLVICSGYSAGEREQKRSQL